ncbi:DUF1573 domain-containing protein [Flagellimonas zhangzhouensis]|uniref:DUF1573 domain-containing protein n=1 Tax=Flagellimonas zhangzhouensis TaxID=1073328 RepID=A0A1H2QUZ1_9FLAO|nr:DUF1573 domain-containing protein [Allomuricauda zhangzhouensis]SDQ56988.1 Protein of unknown function [Allomuricauda zhangzhouensis]SDW10973.1 Protein of unknown function [Allomuricauda zhangzhouensis]
MKRITTIFSLLMAVALVSFSCKDKASEKIVADNLQTAETRDDAQKLLPVMTFEKAEHDFGTIQRGTPQEYSFAFTNTGNAPLIITDAKSSCGCTVPNPPKEPIAPGETGELLVKFNGSGQNQVTKTITVTANTAKGSELLRIKAFVQAPEAMPAGPVK